MTNKQNKNNTDKRLKKIREEKTPEKNRVSKKGRQERK